VGLLVEFQRSPQSTAWTVGYHAAMRSFLTAVTAIALVAGAAAVQRSQPDPARAGWDALNAGRLQEAAAVFGEAVKHSPTPPIFLGAAVVAYLQSRHEEARQHLVAALRMDPGLTAASLLLGEVLHRTGDVDGAILVYEQALARAPDHPQIPKKLETWRKESALHSRFGQRLSDHFTVLFEGPADMVVAPGSEGLMGILPHHAPLLSTLDYGLLTVRYQGEEEVFTIAGGVIEVLPDSVSVLADSGEHAAEIDEQRAEDARRRAEELLAKGPPPDTDEYLAIQAALRRSNLRLTTARKYRGQRPARIRPADWSSQP